jgi:cytochrome c5
MKKRKIPYAVYYFVLFLAGLIFSCKAPDEKKKGVSNDSGEVQSAIDIKDVKVSLPYAKGVDLVESNCRTCHSLRYIEIQPNMTHKAWDKIVKKMVKNYGAPISDTLVVNQIIDYLATIKGAK